MFAMSKTRNILFNEFCAYLHHLTPVMGVGYRLRG